MPEIIRYDDREMICRKASVYRQWGAVVAALNGWLLLFGHYEPYRSPSYLAHVLANPLTYLSTLLLFAVGLLMFGWS